MATENRTRKSQLEQASQVIENVLTSTKSPLADQFMRWKVWRKWDEIVGPTISQRTLPVGYANGIIFVWVKNSVWMQEMIFLAGPLRDKINDFVGKYWAHQVRFTLNRHEVPGLDEPSELKNSDLIK